MVSTNSDEPKDLERLKEQSNSSKSEDLERSKEQHKPSKPSDIVQSKKKHTSSLHWIPKWCHDPPQALVYRQGIPHLAIEEITEANSKPVSHTHPPKPHHISSHLISFQTQNPTGSHELHVIEESNSFEISLPRWRNRVHVYIDMEAQEGYTATLRLDRVGMKKNWQRHLGVNYQVLWVKGRKPEWPY